MLFLYMVFKFVLWLLKVADTFYDVATCLVAAVTAMVYEFDDACLVSLILDLATSACNSIDSGRFSRFSSEKTSAALTARGGVKSVFRANRLESLVVGVVGLCYTMFLND